MTSRSICVWEFTKLTRK